MEKQENVFVKLNNKSDMGKLWNLSLLKAVRKKSVKHFSK